MVNECITYNALPDFAYNTREADRSVVVCRSFITFLVDGCDICRLPVLRNSIGGEGE